MVETMKYEAQFCFDTEESFMTRTFADYSDSDSLKRLPMLLEFHSFRSLEQTGKPGSKVFLNELRNLSNGSSIDLSSIQLNSEQSDVYIDKESGKLTSCVNDTEGYKATFKIFGSGHDFDNPKVESGYIKASSDMGALEKIPSFLEFYSSLLYPVYDNFIDGTQVTLEELRNPQGEELDQKLLTLPEPGEVVRHWISKKLTRSSSALLPGSNYDAFLIGKLPIPGVGYHFPPTTAQ